MSVSTFSELIAQSQDELLALELSLCKIPAPSHKELQRAEFVRDWFSAFGETTIDDAYNCIFHGFDTGEDNAVLITAHSDTVFPDMEPFEPVIDGDYLRCPGAGDDTANAAGLMMLVKCLALSGAKPKRPVIFAINSCEEGLGNLKGITYLMDTYGDRIAEHISFDADYTGITDNAVGSHRYRIEIKTPGGHSYGNFGNTNAIAVAADLIYHLYEIKVPQKAYTTYNVGTISGGTSVNTIAQDVSFLYEYRSEDRECLAFMKDAFERTLHQTEDAFKDASFKVELLGLRPCKGDVPEEKQKDLNGRAEAAIHAVIPDQELPHFASSTDCNIPLSRGIPAVCFGIVMGHGAHTREEYIEISSMMIGLHIGEALMEDYFYVNE